MNVLRWWWLKFRLRSSDSYNRSKAARTLGESGNSQAIGALVRALSDRNQHVRQAAENSLVKVGEPAVEPLSSLLANPASKVPTTPLIKVLGRIGGMAAATALIAIVKKKEPSWTLNRAAAVGWLSPTSHPDKEPAFLDALIDPEWRVRNAALWGLSNTAVDFCVARLAEMLSDPDTRVLEQAVALFTDPHRQNLVRNVALERPAVRGQIKSSNLVINEQSINCCRCFSALQIVNWGLLQPKP
jgi:HEAT repeat protein